jgi:hypothetical protein
LHIPFWQPGSGLPSAFRRGAVKVVRNSTAAKNASVFFTMQSSFSMELHRDNVRNGARLPDYARNCSFSKNVKK